VQRDRENARVVPEHPLDPVAVVHVHVDVRDLLCPVVEQPADRDADVVVDAEAGGVAGHGVVQPAAEVHAVGRLPLPHGTGDVERPGCDPRAGLVHPHERRVVLGAEPAALVRDTGVERGRPHRRDVVGVVDREQDVVVGHARADDLDALGVEHAELLAEPGRQVQPQRVHRVGVTEVVAREALVPDHAGLCWHDGHATGRLSAASQGRRQ
jgi:hypothetical protein